MLPGHSLANSTTEYSSLLNTNQQLVEYFFLLALRQFEAFLFLVIQPSPHVGLDIEQIKSISDNLAEFRLPDGHMCG